MPAHTPAPPCIAVDDLGVQLGDYVALDGVHLHVPERAFLAVLGPNGAGKTTLLKVLLGLVAPTRGRVSVLGMAPAAVPSAQLAYVPQVKTLDRRFPAVAEELVATGFAPRWPWSLGTARRAQARAILAEVGVGHLADRAIGALSGGELQRVYLARALARRPRLVLLDEPATGMDAPGQTDMYRVLETYQREAGATVVMVTHDWEAAYHHATHVALVNRRIVGFGPPQEALREDRLREAFGHVGHPHTMAVGHEPQGHTHGHGHGHPHGHGHRHD
jgi:zinc transport system ATP-binding protein